MKNNISLASIPDKTVEEDRRETASAFVAFRCTPRQKKAWGTKADSAGKTLSQWLIERADYS